MIRRPGRSQQYIARICTVYVRPHARPALATPAARSGLSLASARAPRPRSPSLRTFTIITRLSELRSCERASKTIKFHDLDCYVIREYSDVHASRVITITIHDCINVFVADAEPSSALNRNDMLSVQRQPQQQRQQRHPHTAAPHRHRDSIDGIKSRRARDSYLKNNAAHCRRNDDDGGGG